MLGASISKRKTSSGQNVLSSLSVSKSESESGSLGSVKGCTSSQGLLELFLLNGDGKKEVVRQCDHMELTVKTGGKRIT